MLLALLAGCSSGASSDRLLAEVWTKDQGIRQQLVALTKAVSVEGRADLIDSLIVIHERMEQIDAANIALVDSLLQQGVPAGLSEASYKTLWIVIDHASLDKQEYYLPLVEQMAHEGLIKASEYATLFDRVAMKRNRPQRYGSQTVQFGTPENLQLFVWPVEEPAKLDARRAAVGMAPLACYLQILTEEIGIEAKYNPSMTVEELNSLRGLFEREQ